MGAIDNDKNTYHDNVHNLNNYIKDLNILSGYISMKTTSSFADLGRNWGKVISNMNAIRGLLLKLLQLRSAF